MSKLHWVTFQSPGPTAGWKVCATGRQWFRGSMREILFGGNLQLNRWNHGQVLESAEKSEAIQRFGFVGFQIGRKATSR